MQKIKRKITEITKFDNLDKTCTGLIAIWFLLTIMICIFCVIKVMCLPYVEPLYGNWCDLTEYSYALCGIAATFALVSHTTLTVLISSSENKTFGIELKEFLRNCKWRLRPFTVFGFSIITVLWCVAAAICERPVFLLTLLIWIVLYIGCYSLIVWKLTINTEFAADFFQNFFKKATETTLVAEREQVVSKIFNHLTGLDVREQKYGVNILKNILKESDSKLQDFYKKELEKAFHRQIEENNHYNLKENIFRELCNENICVNYCYCTLLNNTHEVIRAINKESKEKCILLKDIRSAIVSLQNNPKPNEFSDVNKSEDAYIMQFLRNSFTENLGKNGFVYACRELERDAASIEISRESIDNTYIEIYKRLQNSSPEYIGKYEMSRHFSEFRDVFFAKSKDSYYSIELAWGIVSNYIKSLMTATSLFTEKQCRLLTAFVASGMTPFNNQWKDEYDSIAIYENFFRKVMIYLEIQIINLGEGKRRRRKLLEAILMPVNQYAKLSDKQFKEMYIDFFIVIGIAQGYDLLSKKEVKEILDYDIGPKDRKLRKVIDMLWSDFKNNKNCKLHNEVMEDMGKTGITELELNKIEKKLKNKEAKK